MSDERIVVLETNYIHIMEGVKDIKDLLRINNNDHKEMKLSINDIINRVVVTEQKVASFERKIISTQGDIDLVKKDIKDWKTWIIKWLIGTGGAASGITFTILKILS